MMAPSPIAISAGDLTQLVSRIFAAAGMSDKAAATIADGLVQADLDGLPSHGVMLVEMYVARLRAGSVSTGEAAAIVSQHDGAVVLDAGHAFGHLTGEQAMEMAAARARRFGAGVVAVRHGFHFGTARRYAIKATAWGCIGIAMCNTRPLMPAPGGAERLVGNNPIAIALPAVGPVPFVLDMATSEAAMGKIRLADAAGEAIPPSWAVRGDGTPTTDPGEAIAGMLLPAAGPKGFGLALMIDLMCGLLSGGASGDKVRPLYGDPRVPYDCSHLFIALDVGHFCELQHFRAQAAAAAERIRSARAAPGVSRLFAPGEPAWRRRESAAGIVTLEPHVADHLVRIAGELKVPAEPLASISQQTVAEQHHDKA
ncbi:MAG: Ldh family oxidoreductase [Acetobacteraceae bacterium]